MARARADYEFRAEDKTQAAFRRFRRNPFPQIGRAHV